MERVTNTNKWRDDWFLDLSPNGKLTFMFLCDNCDDAGFFSLSTKHMSKYLDLPPKIIVSSVRELGDKIIFNKNRKKIWIKNFLFYQNQLPLEKKNIEHNKIKLVLERNINDFNDDEQILFIIKNQSSVKSKRVTKFTPPTLKQINDFILKYSDEEKFEAPEDIGKNIFNHYKSNGWKVGSNKMQDWESAVRGWLNRDRNKNIPKKGGGKMDKISRANEGITNVNVD